LGRKAGVLSLWCESIFSETVIGCLVGLILMLMISEYLSTAKTPDLMKSKRTPDNSVSLGTCTSARSGRKATLISRLGQATWITLVSLPAILVNTVPRAAHPALGIRDLVGVGIWAGGLGLEILADSRGFDRLLVLKVDGG